MGTTLESSFLLIGISNGGKSRNLFKPLYKKSFNVYFLLAFHCLWLQKYIWGESGKKVDLETQILELV